MAQSTVVFRVWFRADHRGTGPRDSFSYLRPGHTVLPDALPIPGELAPLANTLTLVELLAEPTNLAEPLGGYVAAWPARAAARRAASMCSAAVTTTASDPGYTVASCPLTSQRPP